MNKTILFSPVGGTDPISSSNGKDGSLLHICRVYKPDIVYLYMSKEILDKQKEDNRYLYCLDRLGKIQNHKMEYRIIEKPELIDVQDYDYFYKDFREIIFTIIKEIDETDELLINISSGSPGMKSGLLVLATLGEFPYKMIQVNTPEKAMNEHSHKNYDVKLLWENNGDNTSDFENRCVEAVCPTLSAIKQREIIKKHVEAYNYSAAVEAAGTLLKEETKNFYDLLEMAEARILLDFSKAEKIAKNYEVDCFPIKAGNEKKYFEYALNLDIKLRRKEYVDFIRGITPIIVDMMELILKKNAGIKVDDYCYYTKDKVRKWDRKKLAGTKLLSAFTTKFTDFKYGCVYSIHLITLIESFVADQKIKSLAGELRSVEDNIRNLAAHEIVSVTDREIVSRTGFTAKMIMDKIRRSFLYGGIEVEEEYWNSYDAMNSIIIERMNN